ncbi:unnamed protein product [Arabidopsis halleri]
MAIKKFSSLLLLWLMMLTFIFIPMISGEMINKIREIKQCGMKCYSTHECNETCIDEGYEEGKCLGLGYRKGGVECCCLASSQDGSPIYSP